MTRRVVYGISVWLTIACTAMTIASIIEPRWLSRGPRNDREESYGLHRRCFKSGSCDKFPLSRDCEGDKWSFCSMWRTVGFLVSLAVIVELCTLVSLAIIIMGGVQKRSTGWKVVCSLFMLGGIIQCVAMALVAFLFDNDERFEGWYLDISFGLCTVSWTILFLACGALAATAFYLPSEGGYELIPNHRGSELEIEQEY